MTSHPSTLEIKLSEYLSPVGIFSLRDRLSDEMGSFCGPEEFSKAVSWKKFGLLMLTNTITSMACAYGAAYSIREIGLYVIN